MQCVENKMRKKIRKTRKTLNELRKRTKPFQNVSFMKSNKTNNKTECCGAPVHITRNRLTLLHKTVRSATIARLAHTSHAGVHNSTEGVDNVMSHKIYETRASVKKYDLNREDKSKEDALPILSSSDKEANFAIPNSLGLFSPLHYIDSDQSARGSFQLHPPSESPPALHFQLDSNKYEHLTNSICEHLSSELPLLLNTDIIEKDKSTLRHMYLESHNAHTRGIISPDAMECTDSSREVSSPDMRSCQSPPSSPEISMGSGYSPEYCYYPHRLNQSP